MNYCDIRNSYSAERKLRAIECARLHGVLNAARIFRIHHSMLYRWIQRESMIRIAPKKTRRIGSGRLYILSYT